MVVAEAPALHKVPSATYEFARGALRVRARRADGEFVRFTFETSQAVRDTTGDCFLRPAPSTGYESWRLLEVLDSSWIVELRGSLSATDSGANFLDEAHHYLIDAGDDVIEVVAWGVTWEPA